MKSAKTIVEKTARLALGSLVFTAALAPVAHAQAPYLLPYTISVYAGGGTAPVAGAACAGAPGFTATDAFGDGCPITSSSVIVGASSDIHNVAVDPQGNVYFIDNQSLGLVRRIDARSGVVQVFQGSPLGTQPKANCGSPIADGPPLQDYYGDGCQANDGRGNLTPATGNYLYTTNLPKFRGLGVSRNGDVLTADYNGDTIRKVSAATGIQSIVLGKLSGGTAANPQGYKSAVVGYPSSTPTQAGTVAGENAARGVGSDVAGNIYIADTGNQVVREVSITTGLVSTIAGQFPGPTAGTSGFGGDGGPAAGSTLASPEDVQTDLAGDIFIADMGNTRVRVIYEGGASAASLISATNPGVTLTVGNIYSVWGSPATTPATAPNYSIGTGIVPTSVPVASVVVGGDRKLSLDARGNLYVADNGEDVIWFVDAMTGYMRPIAGDYNFTTATGSSCSAKMDALGDGCPGFQATLNPNSDMGVGVDSRGNVYISDSGNQRIRRVSTNQTFPATAGGGSVTQTLDVHFAKGDSQGTFALTGSADFTLSGAPNCAPNADSTADCLFNVTFTPTVVGNDTASLTVTSASGQKSVFGVSGVGVAPALASDPGAAALVASGLRNPLGLAQDNAGNVFVADTGNNRVVRYTPAGAMTVVAGTGAASSTVALSGPRAVAVSREGIVYIADTGNNVIRRVDPVTGAVTVYGGGGTVCGQATDAFGDGCPSTQSTFSAPAGLYVDTDGSLYVANTGDNIVRELTVNGFAAQVNGGSGFNGPTGIVLDSSRNIFVADTGNSVVREIENNDLGTQNIIAGQSGAPGGNGDNGPATGTSTLSAPVGLAIDAANNLYIADAGNSAIRVVNTSVDTPTLLAGPSSSLPATISTIVGALDASGTGTLPGSAAAVQLNMPSGIVATGSGNLVVLDTGNGRLVSDNRNAISLSLGGENPNSTTPSFEITENNTGSVSISGLGTQAGTGNTNAFSLVSSGANGCSSTTTLTPGTNCMQAATFTPPAFGNFSATYTYPVASPGFPGVAPSITLTGTGLPLTATSATTRVTNPTSGVLQYAVPFTVTTTVTASACNTGAPSCTPTGTVTFFVDGNKTGAPITLSATGTASQTISGLPVGTHSITATYSGDSFYASTSSPALSVVLPKAPTTTVVSASPATSAQFSSVTLNASVTTSLPNVFPTGTVTFYAGSTALSGVICNASTNPGTLQTVTAVTVSNTTGSASLPDVLIPAKQAPCNLGSTYNPGSFGLIAGTYKLTAVYSGDANYAASTSAAGTFVIAPDPQTFATSLSPVTTGTAQGSTGLTNLFVTPQNTLGGSVTFSCTNLPAHSTCTFSPTSLVFAPVSGVPVAQSTQVTLFTDVPTVVTAETATPSLFGRGNSRRLAALLGWPVLLASLAGMLGFRRRLRGSRLLMLLMLCGLLAGGATALSGCNNSNTFGPTQLTPTGLYTVNVNAIGPTGTMVSAPLTFTVTAGSPGQE